MAQRTLVYKSPSLSVATALVSVSMEERIHLYSAVSSGAPRDCCRRTSIPVDDFPPGPDERVSWGIPRWPDNFFGSATSGNCVRSRGRCLRRIHNHQLSSHSLFIVPLENSAVPIRFRSLHVSFIMLLNWLILSIFKSHKTLTFALSKMWNKIPSDVTLRGRPLGQDFGYDMDQEVSAYLYLNICILVVWGIHAWIFE